MSERKGPYRVSEVAEKLGVHRNTVILWCDTGILEAFRTEGGAKRPGHYRIHASAIDAFIAQRMNRRHAA